jgi:ribosomal protein S27AE
MTYCWKTLLARWAREAPTTDPRTFRAILHRDRWECGACDVRWSATGPEPCWVCDTITHTVSLAHPVVAA